MEAEATTTEEAAGATTRRRLSPHSGRPDPGAAAAYVGELFTAHGRMVLGLCRLLLRDPVEAEDAAQQVFVSAQRAVLAGAVPREPAAWLAAIARNECRARIRTRMREPLALAELPGDLPDPLAAAINAADLDALWAALSELPRRQRKAFLLRELGGLSYGELGVALGVTRPAIESLLFRARQYLRSAVTTANAALVPVGLRDQLARFLPELGAGSGTGGVPLAAKVAAVTVGAGLGAIGTVELPKQHAHRADPKAPAAAPVVTHPQAHSLVSEAALTVPVPAPEPQRVTGGEDRRGLNSAGDGAEHEADHQAEHKADHQAEHEAEQQTQPAEPERHDQATEVQRAEVDQGAGGGGGESGSGDRGHSESADSGDGGGSGESGGSGSGGD